MYLAAMLAEAQGKIRISSLASVFGRRLHDQRMIQHVLQVNERISQQPNTCCWRERSGAQ
jgi:hypothetical protein